MSRVGNNVKAVSLGGQNQHLLWRYSRPAWTGSCAACCRWPCFGRGVGL